MKYYTQRENITHKTKNFPLAYYKVDDEHPRYFMMHHWHPEYEIIHVTEGRLELCLDRKHHDVTAGQFALISPGTVHSAIPYNCRYECIVFDLEAFSGPWKNDDKYLGGLLSHKLSVPSIYRLAGGAPETAMLNLVNILRRQNDGFELETVAAVFKLLHALVKCDCIKENENRYSPSRLEPLSMAITYIEQNFNSRITLDELASHCGISPTYFSEYFKKTTGMAPFDYINGYRVECASEMLIYTKKPITEIAISCGFNDLSYFSKTFRAYKGKTPRQYRLEHEHTEKK